MNSLINALKKNKLYSRDELKAFSRKIDFDLDHLCKQNIITKKYHGIYSTSDSNISNEQLIKKIIGQSKSTPILIIDSSNCPQPFDNELGINEKTSIILNNKRADTISINNHKFKFQILSHGFPKKLSKDFLLIWSMNIGPNRETTLNKLSDAHLDLERILTLAEKYGNKSTLRFLKSKLGKQRIIDDLSFDLANLGAPLILSSKLKSNSVLKKDVTEILARACEIALDEPRLHNILPYTLFKNIEFLDIDRFSRLTKKNKSYRYAGLLLDLIRGMGNSDSPTLKPPKYHRTPIIAFKNTYSPRAIDRIRKSHFDLAEKKWGILIDTSFEAEKERIRKWS